jgi:hypothetical protein
MSMNATVSSSSSTMVAGISPATIAQKTQSAMVREAIAPQWRWSAKLPPER